MIRITFAVYLVGTKDDQFWHQASGLRKKNRKIDRREPQWLARGRYYY